MAATDSIDQLELSPYKWASHMDKLSTLAEGGDVYPVTVELDLVSYCNHHCGWCVDPLHKMAALGRPFITKLLRELKELGVEGIVFKGGGEPSLHKAFPEILEEARELSFEVGIVSNGSRLGNMYRAVVQNASYLRVSIDGPNPESHKRIHGSHDFHNIVDGVRKTVEYRRSLGQRHPIIGLSFAMEQPLARQAVRLGDSLGVDYILLRPPFFEEVGRKNTLTIEQKKRLFDDFESARLAYDGPMKVFIDYWISDSEADALSATGTSPRRGGFLRQGANGIEHLTGRCLASPLLAVVTADRKVYPCCNLRFVDGWELGTIDYEQGQTFAEIWQGKKRKCIMNRIHCIECIHHCTHPLSRYNEIIEYLRSERYHRGFV